MGPGPQIPPDPGQPPIARPSRPVLVVPAAALLILGGLFGASQLLVGDFVVTGSLPAKGPIVGVAIILYAASVILGILIPVGRGWLAAINLAALFTIAYLPAMGRPLFVGLGVAHAIAVVVLLRERPWFAGMSAWRAGRDRASRTPPSG